MFHDKRAFAFTTVLEQHWRDIYEEYRGIVGSLHDWVEKELYGEGWQVFGLFNFPHGEPLEQNLRRCPTTAALLQRCLPKHGAAGFSLLQPGTSIRPHQGYPGPYLRCHLGLKVPQGDCCLKLLDEIRHWQEGQALVFDDRVTHEAWNRTPEERVVLLVDFIPSELPETMARHP